MKVIVHLMGGLGNQLFQYALGRRVCFEKPGAELRLYFEDFYKLAKRKYALDNLSISSLLASAEEVRLIGPERGLRRRAKKLIGLPIERFVIRERKDFEYDKTVFETGSDSYLIGFWQSFRYSELFLDQLRKEYFPKEPSNMFSKYHKLIEQDPNSLAIHIRRTDYLKAGSGFAALPIEYYRNSLELMINQIGGFNLYIFCDDPVWVRMDFIKMIQCKGNVHIVSESGCSDTEELILMSQCRNAIIANSSFSWWSAWLNSWPDKKIIAPKFWNGKDSGVPLSDLIPEDWMLV